LNHSISQHSPNLREHKHFIKANSDRFSPQTQIHKKTRQREIEERNRTWYHIQSSCLISFSLIPSFLSALIPGADFVGEKAERPSGG
jgi:hypothetical protein